MKTSSVRHFRFPIAALRFASTGNDSDESKGELRLKKKNGQARWCSEGKMYSSNKLSGIV